MNDENEIILCMQEIPAMALLGNLQLALRHPENKGASAKLCRGIAMQLERSLINIDPSLEPLIKKGWELADLIDNIERCQYCHNILTESDKNDHNAFIRACYLHKHRAESDTADFFRKNPAFTKW